MHEGVCGCVFVCVSVWTGTGRGDGTKREREREREREKRGRECNGERYSERKDEGWKRQWKFKKGRKRRNPTAKFVLV